MDFALDDEQALIVQTVRRFAERELRAAAGDADRAGAAPAALAGKAGELGLFLDAVPAASDGLLDGSYSHLTRALRGYELGRGCAALAARLEANVEPALAAGRWASAETRAALFADLAAGQLATTARDSRGVLAVDDLGAAGVRVHGRLGPVVLAAEATTVLLLAEHAATPIVALVPAAALGRTAITPSGWRAAGWASVEFDQVTLAPAQLLARGEGARAVAAEILAWARVSLAARAAGVAAAAIEAARAYAETRVQFGQPIGRFESLIRLGDDGETLARTARLVALHAAWMLDRLGRAGGGDPAEAFDAASRARVVASDAVTRASIDAVQIFGGYGFVNDYPVEKAMRDARAFEAILGDERLDRVLAGRR
jgi:alkylation response protein AidB-like acyl-CoA dehydrogenase